MSDYKETGTIYKIFPTEQVSASFKKRVIVLKTEGEYSQLLKMELTQGNCDKGDFVKEGQTATIHFNLRGREYINKEDKALYFVSLNAWKIEAAAENTPAETEDNETLPF